MAIVLKDVSYYKILKKINMEIKYGNIVSIIGPNGSGKTIILDLISGVKKKCDGDIKYDKELKISYIIQNIRDSFFCESLESEIEFSLEEINYPSNKIVKRIKDSLKLVGLPESFLSRDPLTLSSSEMRLAALARAVAVNPDVFLIDEPVIGASETEKNNLIQLLKKIKRKFNKTIIIVSQDTNFVHKVSDYIYAISNGENVLSGDKYSVFKNNDILIAKNIMIPSIIEFENYVLKSKKIKLGYRDDINDLVKDILRNIK